MMTSEDNPYLYESDLEHFKEFEEEPEYVETLETFKSKSNHSGGASLKDVKIRRKVEDYLELKRLKERFGDDLDLSEA